MSTRYVLTGLSRYEAFIRKSRFLALAQAIDTADAALAFFAAYTEPGATHHCWAYRVGDTYRFFDDGEPGGTAGRPILQAIDGQHCDRIAVLVIRWFGGVKLGTGGLMRAYGGTAAQCLRLAGKTAWIDYAQVDCHCPFADIARVRARLADFGAHIVREDFDPQGAVWRIATPRPNTADFIHAMTQWTRGQGKAAAVP